MNKGITNIEKPCNTCGIPVKPSEWFLFCTRHLTREHIECSSSLLSNSKHRKCRKIDKNYPTDILGPEKKYEHKNSSFNEVVWIDKEKK